MSVVETEMIIIDTDLVIHDGETSSGLSIQNGVEVDVEGGGTLTESIAKEGSIIVVDPGGVVKETSAEDGSLIYVDGTAEKLTVTGGGAFDIDPGCTLNSATILAAGVGTIKQTASATDVSVSGEGGNFVVSGGSVAKTTVAEGGVFILQNAKIKVAEEEQIFTGLAQSTTILTGGTMSVLDGAVAQDTTMTGGIFHVSSGTASKTVVTGGTMSVHAGNLVQDTVLTGGKMIMSGGSAENTSIQEGALVSAVGGELQTVSVDGGELRVTDANVSGLTVTGGSVSLNASLLAGKTVFAEGASITVDGTVWFDTEYATATDAQIKGAFTTGENVDYMLTAEGAGIGTYLLADNVPSFDGEVSFKEDVLRVGEELFNIDGLNYSLSLNGTALELTITEYIPDDGKTLYVSSAWDGLDDGDPVEVGGITATIGTNAFATGDAAADAAKEIEGANIRILAGEIFFTDPVAVDTVVYHGAVLKNSGVATGVALTVNSGATLAGKAVFAEGANITINGTVAFDTQYVTKDDATSVQFTLPGAPDGTPSYTLSVAQTPETGLYYLLAGVASFAGEVAFKDSVLTVGGAPVTDGVLNYSLSLTGEKNDVLTLEIAEYSDVTGPTISITANPSAATYMNVVVRAEITDESGVKSALYKIVKEGEQKDLIPWSDYEPYMLSGVTVIENNTTVYFQAADNPGNTSESSFLVDYIDRSLDDVPPTITVTPDTTELTSQVVLTATFTDNSGYVPVRQYRLGEDGEWTDYPEEGGVIVTDNITVYFLAKDGADNPGAAEYKVTNIDKPDTEAPVCISVTAEPNTPTQENVVVTAVFTDNVGVEIITYKLDDGGWAECPGGVVTVTQNATVYFQAFDKAGNPSEEKTFVVDFIDRIPPEKPAATADTAAPAKQVTVTAVFSPDSVGREYAVNDGEWAPYPEGGVTVNENCTVFFRGIDAAGNISDVADYIVSNIEPGPLPPQDDTTPPELVYIKADITKPTNKNVTVTASFEDNVGVTSVLYRIGETGEWIVCESEGKGSVTVSENTSVFFQATDAAGNVSDDAVYAVTNIDKTLPDGQAKVFVNPEWAALDPGTGVETFNGDHATVGVNAFGTADEANAAVDADGTIYLDSGTVSFSEAARNVIVHEADLVIDNKAGLDNVTLLDNGSITMTKGVMTNCKVVDGSMTVESGAVVDGLKHDSPYGIKVAVNGATVKNVAIGCQMLMLDMEYTCSMSVAGEGGLAQNVQVISGGNLFVSSGGLAQTVEVVKGGHLFVSSGARVENVDLSGDNENYLQGELYVSSGGMANKVTVSSGGYFGNQMDTVVNDLVVLEGGQAYLRGSGSGALAYGGLLGMEAGGVITGATVAAGGSMYTVSSGGLGRALDTEIHSGGTLNNYGYASNTQVLDGGTMNVTGNGVAEVTEVQAGGTVYFDNVLRDVTVRNGGTLAPAEESYGGALTGRVIVENGANVSMNATQVIDFDISGLDGKEETALVSGFSFIDGTPGLTLTFAAEQISGTYLLADGVTNFDGRFIEFGDYTLTVGETVEAGDFSFTLNYESEILSLTVASPYEPGPEPPPVYSVLYVNSEWSEIADGQPVTFIKEGETVTATKGVDAFATADAAVEKSATVYNPMIDVVGGTVSFSAPIAEPVVIDEAAAVFGAMTFAEGGSLTVDGTILFDTTVSTDAPQIAGFDDNVVLGETAKLSVKIAPAAAGTTPVVLATEASDLFKQSVESEGFTFVVGAPDFQVANVEGKEVSYVLDLDDDDNLVLSYVALANAADNSWNDTLKNNPQIGNLEVNMIDEFGRLLLDEKGTILKDGNYNFVGGTDKADYGQIVMSSAGMIRFSVTPKANDTKDKVKISLVSYDPSTGKTKVLKSATSTKDKVATTAKYYLDPIHDEKASKLQYYVAVENKGKTEVFYNVDLTSDSVFFVDGDDNANNWLVKSKAINQNILDPDEFADTPISLDSGSTAIQMDVDQFEIGDVDGYNWVGFGDNADVARISPSAPAVLNIKLDGVVATGAVAGSLKLVVYKTSLTSKGWKQTAVKTKTVNLKSKNGVETGLLYLDRLVADVNDKEGLTGYYVMVQSTNASKGGEAYYTVTATGNVYNDADASIKNQTGNGWLLDSKKQLNSNLVIGGEITGTSKETATEIALDNDGTSEADWANFVGFGDVYDYAEIVISEAGTYQFSVATNAGNSKFVVYQLTQKAGKTTWTSKTLGSVTIKGASPDAELKKDLKITEATSANVRYFVSMQTTDQKKSPEVYYNVSAWRTDAPSSASLDLSQDLFASQDSFADASAYLADSQLIDDKQSWQSVASLA